MSFVAKAPTQRLLAVHGWSGTVLGLFLYLIVVTGAVAVFAVELGAWSKPGEGRQAVFERPLDPTIAELSESVPEEYMEEVQIFGLNTGELMIFFHGHTENEQGAIEDIGVRYLLDHETHEVIKREEGFRSEMDDLPRSALMDFIVTLHIKLHAPNP